ncbi:MAG: universal stress protein [Candidatus Binatia bacterium]
MRVRRILVPTDFSPEAEAAVKYAADLAKSLRSQIVLFHAIEPLMLPSDLYLTPAIADITDQVEQATRAHVAHAVKQLGGRGVGARGMVTVDRAATAIVEAAAESRAELIVMGTHGRGGVTHLLLGSVAEKVVRTATCPVLTVRGEVARKLRRKSRRGSRR